MELLGLELGNLDLEIDGAVYDLHNSFIFRGFSYDVATRELVLRWGRGKGDWIPSDNPWFPGTGAVKIATQRPVWSCSVQDHGKAEYGCEANNHFAVETCGNRF
jgi:hypothetical protein